MNKELIAYCGLDCAKCEARIATINNDDELRIKVAKEWSILNKVTITKEMINCVGCKEDGIKFHFCESLCPIRICAKLKMVDNCGSCNDFNTCEKIKMVISNNEEALNNLKNK